MAAMKWVSLTSHYHRILSHFPQDLQFCFAYGSGVKKQLNLPQQNMIDLVYCVDDPCEWHKQNLQMNSSHYSSLKYLGHNFIAKYQENSGAKVYFNTLVPLEDTIIKYGVVSTKDFITDLLEWSNLYLAGRLHKPVEIVHYTAGMKLQTALQLNLQSAVHAALLILPGTFSEYKFYHTMANLSYGGDFRMTFGENKNKVDNIVKPQLPEFRKLYKPSLKTVHDFIDFSAVNDDTDADSEAICHQDERPLAKLHHLNQLPRWPQMALTRFWNKGSFQQDTEDVLRAIAYDPDSNIIVEKCIGDIVWKSSVRQSLKGILTAGVFKSIKYSSKKIVKMLQ